MDPRVSLPVHMSWLAKSPPSRLVDHGSVLRKISIRKSDSHILPATTLILRHFAKIETDSRCAFLRSSADFLRFENSQNAKMTAVRLLGRSSKFSSFRNSENMEMDVNTMLRRRRF